MFGRTYNRFAGGADHEGVRTVELHFDDGRVVQITAAEGDDPRGDGMVLLRAWGPNGTAENGGNNLEDLSITFFIGEDETEIDTIRYHRDTRKRMRESRERREAKG